MILIYGCKYTDLSKYFLSISLLKVHILNFNISKRMTKMNKNKILIEDLKSYKFILRTVYLKGNFNFLKWG